MQVELRLGGERQDVGVAGTALGERTHLGGVAFLVDDARLRVARGERRDQGAVPGRCVDGQRLGPPDRGLHARGVGLVHVGVDGGPERPRQSPEADRALRVCARSSVERARRLGGVEAPREHYALVEKALGERHRRAGGVRVRPHAVQERCALARLREGAEGERGAGERDPGARPEFRRGVWSLQSERRITACSRGGGWKARLCALDPHARIQETP